MRPCDCKSKDDENKIYQQEGRAKFEWMICDRIAIIAAQRRDDLRAEVEQYERKGKRF